VTDVASSTLPGSSSLQQPDYWWYRARAGLLGNALGSYLGEPARVLDVGSADGPSVGWMEGGHARFTIDVDPRGLKPGQGTCASALALPFPDGAFDVVGAFDVLEHCEPESVAIKELARVIAPGGRLLLSVPAYQWAWSDHDVRAGHHRRYTKARLLAAVGQTDLTVVRSTYAFCAVFPFFAAERIVRRLKRGSDPSASRLPEVSPMMDKVLMSLTRAEEKVIRKHDLPFGSSVLIAAVKPTGSDAGPDTAAASRDPKARPGSQA
jgi:SAM-dependent methyltransferase